MELITFVLTTYNCEKTIGETIKSILWQDYAFKEIVIVDGMSSDNTVNIIQHYAVSKKNNIRWISENDNGLYHALNKAIKMARGEYIQIMNDQFTVPDAATKLVMAIKAKGSRCVGAHGDLIYGEMKKVIRYWKMGEGQIKDGWMPAHPTLCLRRCVYEKYGYYRMDYKCAADYEFMIRFLKDEYNCLAYVPEILVQMYYGGTSTDGLSGYLTSLKEGHKALVENGIKKAWLIDIRRIIRVLTQFGKRRELLKNGER